MSKSAIFLKGDETTINQSIGNNRKKKHLVLKTACILESDYQYCEKYITSEQNKKT